MFYNSNWIHSFPQTLPMVERDARHARAWRRTARWRMGEIDQVMQKLHARIDRAAGVVGGMVRDGERIEALADDAAAAEQSRDRGQLLPARRQLLLHRRAHDRAGRRRSSRMYKKSLHCSHEGLKRRYSNIEFVDVPYEGKSLPAYFLKSPVAKGPAPTVVLFDGLDNCKEMSVLFAGLELAFRGYHTLAIDGPGQGEALRLRNHSVALRLRSAGRCRIRVRRQPRRRRPRTASR